MGVSDTDRLVASYAWADGDDPRLEAISITLVEPADGSALSVLTPRREIPGELTVEQGLAQAFALEDFATGSLLAQLDRLADWDVIIEPCGWAASLPGNLAALSGRGTAINVFWNVNAVIVFSLARGGAVVRTFDVLLDQDSSSALPEEAGLRWGSDAPRASALALLERLSGSPIEQDWLLGRARRSFVIQE